MQRVIRLPNGKRCGLRVYVSAWKQLRTMDPEARVSGFDHFPEAAGLILRALREGMHDRINRHDPAYGRGRKWDQDWQARVWRLSRDVNHPRLALSWIPPEFRDRFAHRLTSD